MDVAALLLELYGRIPPLAHEAVDGLGPAELTARPTADANTIAWLIWHLTRVQDHHVAELLDGEQLWVAGPWAAQLGLGPDPHNTGYGHSSREVETVRPAGPDVLLDYLGAVDERTRAMLAEPHPCRPRPHRRPALGPTGDPRRPPGQRRRRLPPARRTGRLPPGSARRLRRKERT